MMDIRTEALALLTGRFPEYEFHWTDSRGDFDGREFTIDVFGVPVTAQREFLKAARETREVLFNMIGSRCLFIFRSREMLSDHQRGKK